MRFSLLILLSLTLTACGSDQSATAETSPSTTDKTPVGADLDPHGCIRSAGYLWCESTQSCERPWELAEAKNFTNSEEGFKAFCEGD